jgi:hypothetical protein
MSGQAPQLPAVSVSANVKLSPLKVAFMAFQAAGVSAVNVPRGDVI